MLRRCDAICVRSSYQRIIDYLRKTGKASRCYLYAERVKYTTHSHRSPIYWTVQLMQRIHSLTLKSQSLVKELILMCISAMVYRSACQDLKGSGWWVSISITLVKDQHSCCDILLIMPVDKLRENDAWESQLIKVGLTGQQNNRLAVADHRSI